MEKQIEKLIERVRLTKEEVIEIVTKELPGFPPSQIMWGIVNGIKEAQLNKVLADPDLALIDRNIKVPTRYWTAYEGTDAQGYILAREDYKNAGYSYSVIPLAEGIGGASDIEL